MWGKAIECLSIAFFIIKEAKMKEKVIGIYKIQNIINGKMYIGLSSNIYKRWNIHKCILRKNMCKNQHLQYAWNKHGEESFVFSIIEQCEKQFLSEKEKYYIN